MLANHRRRSRLVLFAFVSITACASSDPADGAAGSAGVPVPGGGGSSGSGGGGNDGAGSGGTSGGTLPEVGSSGVGGSSAGSGGTSGTSGAGGSVADAGGSGGSAMGGGRVADAGREAAVVSPPVVVGIPAGYPTAAAENRAKCKTVPMDGAFCPGGGAGPICMQCLFGGTTYATSETTPTAEGTMLAGNYLVTVKLGGAAAGQTFISAESSRALLRTATAAGESQDYAFVVNVRAMEGQPRHAGGPAGYAGLNLFLSGPTSSPPQVSAIGYALAAPATKPVMVYMAGDSTVCDQTGNEFGGWGQMLPQHFAPPIGIANYANSGASSNFGFWNDIKAKWAAGDWVIIQFGHNDKGVADSAVQANLESMVADALAANVTPIVVSPPARAQFSGAMVSDQSSLHAAAAKAAAASKKVAYIDLTSLSTTWYNTLASEAAALKFHANGTDATHTNLAGAEKLASLVAADIKAQNLGLAKYLRP